MIPNGKLSTNDRTVIPMIANFLKKKLLEGRVYKREHIMTVILYVAHTSNYYIIMSLRVIFINLKGRCF